MQEWRRNLFVLWLTQILAASGFGFTAPFLPFYIQELGVTDPKALSLWVGLLTAAPAIGTGIMAPVWGHLADRYGKKLMILRSTGAGAVAFGLLGLATSVQLALALRVLQGFFTGVVAAAAALVASSTPDTKQASSLGFLSSATFIGVSVGPALGGVVAELVGVRKSFLYGALLLLLGFISVLLFVRENKSITTVQTRKTKARTGITNRRFMQPVFIALFAVVFFVELGRLLPAPFIALYIQELTGSLARAPSKMGFIYAGRGAATAIAGVTIARLGDRVDKNLLIALFLVAACLLAVPIYFTESLVGFAVLYIAGTFFIGGIPPVVQSALSSKVKPNERGMLFGVQSTIGSAAWFAAPLMGSAVSINFGIKAVFVLLALLIGLGIVPLIVYRFAKSSSDRR